MSAKTAEPIRYLSARCLEDARLGRDVRRLLTAYREHGEIVSYRVLMLRIQARFSFIALDRDRLHAIIASEARKTGLVMEFDGTRPIAADEGRLISGTTGISISPGR